MYMKRLRINDIQKMKGNEPIVCLTSCTSPITKIIENMVDILLVGDSLGTTLYGMKNTRAVNIDMMIRHGKAVVNSSQKPFTIIDMPYKSYLNKRTAYKNASSLLKLTGCQSVKIETNNKNVDIVSYLTKKNVKVISHIGVTPQDYNDFSKIRAVGRAEKEKSKLIDLALKLEEAGSVLLLLECIVKDVAMEITSLVNIPTIGIGSSVYCDGQVLVTNDLLGIEKDFVKPKFVKSYANLSSIIKNSVKKFSNEVKKGKFPNNKYTYK